MLFRSPVEASEEPPTPPSELRAVEEEVKHLAKAITLLATAIQRHNTAISDLYAIQEVVMKQLVPTSSIDTKLPDMTKGKPEKPN